MICGVGEATSMAMLQCYCSEIDIAEYLLLWLKRLIWSSILRCVGMRYRDRLRC